MQVSLLIGVFSGITFGGIMWYLDYDGGIKGLLTTLFGVIFIIITVIVAIVNKRKDKARNI